ncbi:uncharacterized protein LOC116286242 [Actinia tenebrosa]|uniref:Uncharacterized protein LOC116286242 n=1 Tax=Actinia tenebrosa TaxID=6105 RepID=A0A6P8GZP0_ACTTE|nr:uncharacterized protein LOC116286242 [Actinia tenebrosa]
MALYLEDKHKKAIVRLEIINKDTKEFNELGFATKIYMPEKEDIVLITSPSIFPDGIDAHLDEIVVHRWKPKPKQKDPVKVKSIESHKQADVNTVVFEGEKKYSLQYKVLTEKEIKKHRKLTACVFEGELKVELQFENQGGSYKLSNVSKEGFNVKRAKGAPVIIKEYSHHILGIPRYNHKIVGVLSMNSNGDVYPALFKDGFLGETS